MSTTRSRSRANWKPNPEREFERQQERVALARLEDWLKGFGSVKGARLDGIAFPDEREPLATHGSPSHAGCATAYIEVSTEFKKASPMIQYLLLMQYVRGDERDIRDLLEEWFGGDIPRVALNVIETVAKAAYRRWKLRVAGKLSL